MSQAILDADDKSLIEGNSVGMRRGSTGALRNSLNSSLCMDRDNSHSRAKLLSTIMDMSRVESIKQMDVGENGEQTKIFIESA